VISYNPDEILVLEGFYLKSTNVRYSITIPTELNSPSQLCFRSWNIKIRLFLQLRSIATRNTLSSTLLTQYPRISQASTSLLKNRRITMDIASSA